jgi:hypothetical protein
MSAALGAAVTQQQQQQQPMEVLAEAQTSPASIRTAVQQHLQQQEPPRALTSRSALAPALAAAAQQQQQPPGVLQAAAAAAAAATQQQQQQQGKPEGTTADWARSVADACGLSPMSLGATPVMGLGFGPMSLSPAIGLQDLGMGGVGSLTEADVAAMWADDEEQDAGLAEALLRQGPWSFER